MLMIFAVYDEKACSYGAPMFFPSRGVALRSFSDVVANRESPLAKHPGDYKLYDLGTFDPNSGKVVANQEPLFIVSATDVDGQLKVASAPQGELLK